MSEREEEEEAEEVEEVEVEIAEEEENGVALALVPNDKQRVAVASVTAVAPPAARCSRQRSIIASQAFDGGSD